MHDDIAEILFTEEDIARRVNEIGAAITRDYADYAEEGIVLVSVLRGAAIFMADLARKIDLPVEMDYMAISSYGNGAKSSGVVRILKDLTSQIEGRHVIVAEDILDSGLTLTYLLKNLASRRPASLKVATLLRKRTRAQAKIDCAYVGFECPDEFIVGYGLDFAERYRNLPYIGVLRPEMY
ncbi:hypoxanthine phosphoribosyltransferase [Gordonibacter sp. An230]|uniref:hypoxanthine phosphoribosyltransferase n=1 Tax=Gordonibacter sp. An230 TaxID=1965592 RepID=UPI000B3A09AF|nr:hypoxanthine phosphoribosyltransferase [Gordonibacter sp. An230]OUO89745.1 hypoxanthine phosphoribosyltransferase [Gordonibacter sp. An230]